MTFIFPALLAGLALAALPVVLHLILKQQPKQLKFPAFQFLARKATTNRRRLRLRHLLLLAMRILMVALMCLALARPRVLNERLYLSTEQPAAAVLVLDTSLSMGYTVAGQTRLDEAKTRALEIITGLPASSRIAILDPSEPGSDWQPSLSAARERITSRELQANAGSMSDSVAAAYRLFEALAREAGENETPPPRFVYVLTDRAPASWDATRTRDLVAAKDRLTGAPIQQVVIDVGVDKPADVAIADVRFPAQVVPANKPIVLAPIVQATGQDVDTEVRFRLSGQADAESKSVKLAAGQTKDVAFVRRGLAPGMYQGEVSLGTTDALMADNIRHVTFEVRAPQPILILCDKPEDAKTLRLALAANYPCDVRTVDDPAFRVMTPSDLAKYRVVAMLSIREPTRDLWEKLDAFVAGGGGLLIFPGGNEMRLANFNQLESPVQAILPATFNQLRSSEQNGVTWTDYQYQHPMMATFRDDAMQPETGFAENPPRTYRYWEVTPKDNASVLARYGDQGKHAALLESTLDRMKYRGRVLLFTTPFDDRRDARDRPWNDYAEWWFYVALTNRAARYVGGTVEEGEFNHVAGRMIALTLPANVRGTALNLVGPGLSGPDSIVSRGEKQQEVRLLQARAAGNYQLSTADGSWKTGFSVNAAADEFQLLPRVPVETLAELFGSDCVLKPGESPLASKLDQHFQQPVELFPWLMLVLLLLFAFENVLANRFYRKT